MNIGDRVNTLNHGPGTVMDVEEVNDAWPGQPPRMIKTGRYGVKLDTPMPHFSGKLAYFWPNETEPES